MAQQEDVFKKIISHCKEYGFVFPSSDIYDGLGAVYVGMLMLIIPIATSVHTFWQDIREQQSKQVTFGEQSLLTLYVARSSRE